MIDKATQQKIKDTADIVDVVSDYVHLVRSGGGYKGLCPFHNERTPSFSVNKARNFCYCFSCKKGGSPVNFLMQKEGLSYNEALRALAKRYGIKIEEKELTDEERSAMEHREALFIANEWAMQHFEQNLHDTDDGRDIGLQYFYSRGVTEEAIQAFHLGYALDKGQAFLNEARKKGFNVDLLKELGLIGTSATGHDYDRFRGRVIFPIMTSSGKVVGFGGRTLKQDAAKYVNSPESEIYKKSNELYGMAQARSAIVKEERCFLVEGYLDVIGMWQSGIKNVVASSGTALTKEQVSLIHRFAKRVTLVYDGDEPGIKAALRGMDMLLDENLDVDLLLLPDGDDPDSFSKKHTPEEFREYIEQHTTDVIRFKAQVLMDKTGDRPDKRIAAIRSMVKTLSHISEKVKRDVYIQECSKIMDVSQTTISESVADALAEIRIQKQKEKNLSRLNRDINSGRIEPQTNFPVGPSHSSAHYENRMPQPSSNGLYAARENPELQGREKPGINNTLAKMPMYEGLQPVEWDVIRYCLKYGFLDFCESIAGEEDGSEQHDGPREMLTVVEYIEEEMLNDGLEFTVESFAYLFGLLKEMLPQFREDLKAFKDDLEPKLEARRQEGYAEIASKNLNISEIKREEQRLNEEIERLADEEVTIFSRTYPSRFLASHENDFVRALTNKAVLEEHQLSHIYSRERPVESEEDKLFTLVPTAVTVWKNGVVERQYHELSQQLRIISGTGNEEEERQIMARLSELMKLRSELAKNIGDRIICPMSRKRIKQ